MGQQFGHIKQSSILDNIHSLMVSQSIHLLTLGPALFPLVFLLIILWILLINHLKNLSSLVNLNLNPRPLGQELLILQLQLANLPLNLILFFLNIPKRSLSGLINLLDLLLEILLLNELGILLLLDQNILKLFGDFQSGKHETLSQRLLNFLLEDVHLN